MRVTSKELGLVISLALATVSGVALAQQGSSGLGTSSLGSLDRLDVTRPAEQAQLMSARNALLLQTGSVDPDTYVLGPGDLLALEFLGAFSLSGEDVVSADGHVTFPQIGTFKVGGITLSKARRLITGRSEGLLRGGKPTLLLKSMRTFKIQIVGKVGIPGSHAASPTTRVSEVIQAAEGVIRDADVRNIRIIHTDGTTSHADLIPFLLAGRLDTNPILADGDVVFVPIRTEQVEFLGAVLQPGRYDFVEGDELGALLELVGLHPRVDRGWAILQRYTDGVHWDTLSVDLRSVLEGVSMVPLKPGDRVLIRSTGDWHTGAVAHVKGAVRFPGPVPVIRGGLTVRGAIDLAGGMMDEATAERVILGRWFLPDSTRGAEMNPEGQVLQSMTLQLLHEAVVDLSGGAEGPVVDPGDIITVPRFEGWVEVLGQVVRPGFYDYHGGWVARDYIEAAGGFASYADGNKTQVSKGRFGDIGYSKDMDELAPGDIIWVPEKTSIGFWTIFKDVLAVTSQAAALLIIVRNGVK